MKQTGRTDSGNRSITEPEGLNCITELRLTTSASDASLLKSPGIFSDVTQLLRNRFGKHVCYFD